uniref:Galactokinase n=1 Tax=Solanum tuberosum TaxID=4113 RepID=M1CW21_SOLTU
MKKTSQLKRPAAAFCSLMVCFPVFVGESTNASNPAKLFKKLKVSDRPRKSPWRISKS